MPILAPRPAWCSPTTRARLETFLDAYGAAGSPLRYERGAVIAATVERLHAIAAWVREFLRKGGSSELAGHAGMYTAHAGWLSKDGLMW